MTQATHLDLLELLDRHTREGPMTEVSNGSEMHNLAIEAGLVEHGNESAARWTGELVDLGYVGWRTDFRLSGMIPRGVLWTNRELQGFGGYRVLPTGREEAERIRRFQREQKTDVTLGRDLRVLRHPWLTDVQQQALTRPLHDLRAALEDGRDPAAVGAAKELVEAACKVVLAHLGKEVPSRAKLPALFKEARRAAGISDGDIGRSLSATVEALAELRNIAGSGHGRAHVPPVSTTQARLAAGTASALAEFLMDSIE